MKDIGAISRSGKRVKGLDGLRAIAVVLVLIMHKTEFGTSSHMGFYGVWLFFLLSGYLITGQLQAARERVEGGGSKWSAELMTFWRRRAFRIFPAYYVVLAGICCYYLATRRELHGTLFYALHLSNIYLSNNMEQFRTTWAHFWSLAVEEQFYLLFAPLLLFTRARLAIPICVALIAASVFQRTILTSIGMEPFRIYIDSVVNVGLLAAGGLLFLISERATLIMRRTRLDCGIAGWTALLLFLLLAVSTTLLLSDYPVILQTSYVIGCCVAIVVLANVISGQTNSMVRLLEFPVLVLIGRLSYSIYLINDYVPSDIPQRLEALAARRGILVVHSLMSDSPAASLLVSSAGVLLCFAIVMGAASLLWTFVERPALSLRDRVPGELTVGWLPPNSAAAPVIGSASKT